MGEVMFKLKRFPKHHTSCRPMIINNPDLGMPIYEYSTCYVPERYGDSNKNVRHFRVYFWRDAGYWQYINNCSVQNFETLISPRIFRNTKKLTNG